MKKAATLTAMVLALAAGSALAHEGGRHDRMKAADTNGDGMISKAEAAALPRLAQNFDEIDANKDGQVTSDEMRAHQQKKRAEHWKKLDTNADGAISKSEAAAEPRLAGRFDQLDANKDGQVTQDEMKAAHGRGRK